MESEQDDVPWLMFYTPITEPVRDADGNVVDYVVVGHDEVPTRVRIVNGRLEWEVGGEVKRF
jgi:hypothetical protein